MSGFSKFSDLATTSVLTTAGRAIGFPQKEDFDKVFNDGGIVLAERYLKDTPDFSGTIATAYFGMIVPYPTREPDRLVAAQLPLVDYPKMEEQKYAIRSLMLQAKGWFFLTSPQFEQALDLAKSIAFKDVGSPKLSRDYLEALSDPDTRHAIGQSMTKKYLREAFAVYSNPKFHKRALRPGSGWQSSQTPSIIATKAVLAPFGVFSAM